VCISSIYVKKKRAFQSSSLVELIATGKYKLYEASATPESLFSSLCRKLCMWLWHLIKLHGWWCGESGEKNLQGEKVQKKKGNLFLISFISS